MRYLIVLFCLTIYSISLPGQSNQAQLYKVLTLSGPKSESRDIPHDHGLNGIWQKLLKLQTTASVLHTQAHPDDEHADLLTFLSRGRGVRASILSLNRGESGGNILGVESFDRLGLLRTEEFLLAGSYYGLDDLYFTRLVDYGFSKRVEEAYEKWGRENILSEMVRVIRINRPLVIISRFHGSARDGHGNHQAAGEISPEAYRLAGDPSAFPEQIIKEGLRPWKALKYYRGGIRENEHWNIALNTGEYCTWLGDTYKNFSLLGYSFHRSQNGGHRHKVNGSFLQYYERVYTTVNARETENSFFEGIDTTISGIFKITRETAPAVVLSLLTNIQQRVKEAVAAFQPTNPTALIPFLTKGLADTRTAIKLLNNEPDARFILLIKERQFIDAINTVLGLKPDAIALPIGKKETTSLYQPQVTMGFAVPGKSFNVEVSLVNGSNISIEPSGIQLSGEGLAPMSLQLKKQALRKNEKLAHTFLVKIPEDHTFSQPYYHRASLQESEYSYDENRYAHLPNGPSALAASFTYFVAGEPIEILVPVQVREANLPYGYNKYNLKVAPGIAINVSPPVGIIPLNSQVKEVNVGVELINNYDTSVKGQLRLKVPDQFRSDSSLIPFSFSKAGEKSHFTFKVPMPALKEGVYEIHAEVTISGKSYSKGYDLTSYRDVDQTIMYRPAKTLLKVIDVKVAPNLQIGYIMGVGDDVPAAIRQLGATVQLLTSTDLSGTRLDKFDVIMVGTRAYAVRPDLGTYNSRLLDYAKKGGHLIVLFQTPEFVPNLMAAYPAKLPANPEEVAEENSVVTILDPNHRVFKHPNKITSVEFDNWVEQRGSKFFAEWDPAYRALISTQDIGQAPQKGGWLMAPYGQGHYTYFAYSFHRQLPLGVEGPYKIMANLLSYGKK